MFGKCCQAVFILLLTALLSACSASLSTWRSRTSTMVAELASNDALIFFPQEYRNLLETFEHGEALLQVRKDEKNADIYYKLAFQKAEILKPSVKHEQDRLAAERQKQLSELAAKAEQEQLMRAAAEAEARMRARQSAQSSESSHLSQKKNKLSTSSLPTYYTVRRGETLPQISARAEIYNDSTLWPIIYRANRDQIRDPKRLWPGQVFVIPRNFSRDEAVEARRFSNKK